MTTPQRPSDGNSVGTSSTSRLSWTLTICTYNRPHFLVETLGFALTQTRPPAEIVVVDASDNWAEHYAQMRDTFAAHWDKVALTYVPARVRSLTFQRNQALHLASSDIVFSLDDDIYLFPDAAEKIMRIYEADPEENIAMVAGAFTSAAYDPDAPEIFHDQPAGPVSLKARLRGWLDEQLTLDGHFVPYGPPVDRSELPAEIGALGGYRGGLINGGRTTFRRKYGLQTGWSELLRYYSTHEDSDMSYRMSRLGRLVHATSAGFFHADGNEGNASRYRINMIRVRNMIALHNVHSDNRPRSAWRLAASFLRFAALYAVIDPLQGRLGLPTMRAYLFGLAQIPYFLFWPFADFGSWYTRVQEDMYGNRYSA